MAERKVKVVLELGAGFAESMKCIQAAAEAHPMGDDETPAEWMRRVIDAACWHPDGWTEWTT